MHAWSGEDEDVMGPTVTRKYCVFKQNLKLLPGYLFKIL